MSVVTVDHAALDAFLNGPDGPVAQDLARRALNVESRAKINATGAPVEGAINPEGRGPRVRTGRLRSSITFVIGRDEQGLFADIGTNVTYGGYLERGELRGGYKYPFLVPALPAAIF